MRDAAVGFQCPQCVRGDRTTRNRQPRTIYGGRVRRRDRLVTESLIGLNVAAWLWKLAAGPTGASVANSVDRRFALYGHVSLNGQYYRLLTSAFLHVSWLHIALNMYLLWLLGPALESWLGRSRFLALYLAGALGGGSLAYLSGQGGEGASGALFGLFAAFYVLNRRLGRDNSQVVLLIVLNLVLSFTLPGIGYWAHLGGLAAGAIVAAGYAYAPRNRWRIPVQAAGLVLVLAVAGALTATRTVLGT
jgi:membrane associated rhomboid family serine protease